MGQLSGWQQGKGPEGLRTGRWWGAKWESRGGAHRGGGRRDLGGGRGQLPAEGPASTGPGQGRVRGRKEACVCSEACVRQRRPERQAGATPAGRWSSDAERGSVVRGGPSVSVRVSVHVNGVGACVEGLTHLVFRVLGSGRWQLSPLSTLSWQTSSLTSSPRVRPCFREWTFWVSVRNVCKFSTVRAVQSSVPRGGQAEAS